MWLILLIHSVRGWRVPVWPVIFMSWSIDIANSGLKPIQTERGCLRGVLKKIIPKVGLFSLSVLGGAVARCLRVWKLFIKCPLFFLSLVLKVEASRRWRNSNVAKCVCVAVWLFAIVVTYSFLSTAFQHTGCCLSKLLFLTITEFFLPLVIIVVFTLRIMWALADRRLMQQSRYN